MKQTLINQVQSMKEQWLNRPALRYLALLSVLVLLLGYGLGGLKTAMLLTGYLQLLFRAVLPGEPVENRLLQRSAALAGGLARMLFFTGMMANAAWPFLLIAGVQAVGLLLLAYGERIDTELSLLPLLASSGFLLLGLIFGAQFATVWITLTGMLALTAIYLLLHGRQHWNQLKMRFHLA
ncbi:MAG TPA: hypothetical protein P5559_01950 [Candidatus Limiplasma sp.]|nr:hypothetical protein [Candidatus Limiplasma sp.]